MGRNMIASEYLTSCIKISSFFYFVGNLDYVSAAPVSVSTLQGHNSANVASFFSHYTDIDIAQVL